MLNLLFFLFLTGSLACQEERSRFDRAVAVGLEDAFPILYPHCSNRCADLWTNVRAAVPDPCDERCWEDVQEGFLRRHAALAMRGQRVAFIKHSWDFYRPVGWASNDAVMDVNVATY